MKLMTLNEVKIKKVNNGFLVIAEYDKLIGDNEQEKYVFNNFDSVISKLNSLFASEY